MKRVNNYIHTKPKEKKKESRGGTPHHHTKWWRERSKAFRMQNQLCEMCEAVGITKAGEEVDHKEPVPRDATFNEFKRMSEWENLQTLCRGHHARKTAIENNERRRKDKDS